MMSFLDSKLDTLDINLWELWKWLKISKESVTQSFTTFNFDFWLIFIESKIENKKIKFEFWTYIKLVFLVYSFHNEIDFRKKNAPEEESNPYALRHLQDLKSWQPTRATHRSDPLNYTSSLTYFWMIDS